MRCRRILAAGLGALLLYPVLLAGQEPRKITVVARKYEFSPNRIDLKTGEPPGQRKGGCFRSPLSESEKPSLIP
jgi:hypothetical protein